MLNASSVNIFFMKTSKILIFKCVRIPWQWKRNPPTLTEEYRFNFPNVKIFAVILEMDYDESAPVAKTLLDYKGDPTPGNLLI